MKVDFFGAELNDLKISFPFKQVYHEIGFLDYQVETLLLKSVKFISQLVGRKKEQAFSVDIRKIAHHDVWYMKPFCHL
jgi:hypothetical protein